MAGHSKWANIKRKKAKTDAQRSSVISKALRDVMLAARHGGNNPDINFRLKMAIDKARQANVPVDSINRSIKRGTGETQGGQLDEITYEGYGPGGVAVLAEAATDNRNRTASEIRHIFSKHGGKLAEIGAVAWMFDQRGYIALERSKFTEEEAFEMCVEAGALDMNVEDDVYEVYTEPSELEQVKTRLESLGAEIDTAELTMLPKNYVKVDSDDATKMLTLFDLLESHDDVSQVYANFDIPDDVLKQTE